MPRNAVAHINKCRLGELLPSSLSILLLVLSPCHSSFRRSTHNPHSHIVCLPHTKTHRHGQDVVLVDHCNPINPISLLMRHLQINNIPHDAHLFSYATPNGFCYNFTFTFPTVPITHPLHSRNIMTLSIFDSPSYYDSPRTVYKPAYYFCNCS